MACFDTLAAQRAAAVAMLNKSLDTIKPVDAPRWALITLMVPVFLGLVMLEACKMVWLLGKIVGALLIEIVAAPFAVLYVFVDVVVIIYWYTSLVVWKMNGGRE